MASSLTMASSGSLALLLAESGILTSDEEYLCQQNHESFSEVFDILAKE